MSSPSDAAGELASPAVAPTAETDATAPSPRLSGAPLHTGQRWHAYQIEDAIACDEGWAFRAVNVGALEDVHIHVRPLDERRSARREAWKKLQEGKYPGLIPVAEALEEDGFRFETTAVPPPTLLREWALTHRPSLDDVETLLRQLAAAMQAIHSCGIVHGNLSLDTVHLVPGESSLKVLIGGFGQATLFEQTELIPLPVNPLYAPPEAAGLTKHTPGPGLRAWDWWSLGRIIQELVLGQPVLGLLLDRDVARLTPELRRRAEDFLLERDAAHAHAGAVEKMPPMSDDLASLLRGLLSSCRDGRWGWREVETWLRRQPVADRYELTRHDRLFLHQDRAFTLAEAAEFFCAEENWNDGEEQLFALKNPRSLIAFVTRESELSPVKELLDSLRDFMQLPAWRELPVEIVRTAIAAVSWLQIGAERRPLIVRGRAVDAAFLRERLGAEAGPEGLTLVRAMLAPPFVQLVTSRDATTARLLSVVSTNANETIATAERNQWLAPQDAAGLARLLRCVLENEPDLLRRREELRKEFALCRHATLETIFKAPKVKAKELMLLAFAAGEPERTGFVTHAEWNRERYRGLRERGERLAALLYWRRLEHALNAGRLVFGRWPWVLAAWASAGAALAILGPAPWGIILGALLAGALLGLRALGCAALRVTMRRYANLPEPWTLRSRVERCAREIAAHAPGELPKKSPRLAAELHALNREIAQLELSPRPALVAVPPPLSLHWLGAATGWLLLVIGAGWTAWQYSPGLGISWARETRAGAPTLVGPPEPARDDKPVLTSEQRFFGDPRTLMEPWKFQEPTEAPPLPVRGVSKPTAEQIAGALIDGQRLLAPFPPAKVTGVIAVPVAAANEAGVMLYDAIERRLVERRIFQLEKFPDKARTWHELDRRKVLYLGAPRRLDIDMWSDDRPFLQTVAEHLRDEEEE
jgi:hypothetical protein